MKEDAVSPVVGVMLMLTVTIILAAVFATAAGSVFSKDAEPVNAELIYVKEDADKYIFEMKSGEPFTLSALKIVYTFTLGKVKIPQTVQNHIKPHVFCFRVPII